MMRRRIGVAGIVLTLLGCGGDPTLLPVVDGSAPSPGLPTSRRAAEIARSSPLFAAKAVDPADPKGDGPAEPKTAEDFLKKGMAAANRDDLPAAIAAFEQGHKLDPKDRPILTNLILAQLIQAESLPEGKERMALSLRSAELARALRELAKGDARPVETVRVIQGLFTEACAYAKDKQPDKALASLNEAVEAGLDVDKLLTEEPALAPLRGRAEFSAIVAKVKESARKAMKKRDDAVTREMMPEVKRDLPKFKPFPFTFELPGLDGKTVKLDDYKGKVTVVDIWGTWCPPCRMEIPHLIALQDNFKDKGVAVIGINREKEIGKEKELILPFVKETGINYTLVIGDDRVEEKIPDFAAFPTTLFLDREGKVRYKHVGYATYEVLEYIVKTILDDKGGKPATR